MICKQLWPLQTLTQSHSTFEFCKRLISRIGTPRVPTGCLYAVYREVISGLDVSPVPNCERPGPPARVFRESSHPKTGSPVS
jgi:hypothetical protein